MILRVGDEKSDDINIMMIRMMIKSVEDKSDDVEIDGDEIDDIKNGIENENENEN